MSKSSVITAPRVYGRPAVRTIPARPIPSRQPKPKLSVVRNKPVTKTIVMTHEVRKALITSLIGIISILCLQLAFSTMTAANVYNIAALKKEASTLSQDLDIMEQQVSFLSSPQNLTEQAAKMGMTNSSTPAYLSIETGKVMGKPTPAGTTPITGNLVSIESSDGY